MRSRLIGSCGSERDAALEKLKVYGRAVEDADPIFTKDVSSPKETWNGQRLIGRVRASRLWLDMPLTAPL